MRMPRIYVRLFEKFLVKFHKKILKMYQTMLVRLISSEEVPAIRT